MDDETRGARRGDLEKLVGRILGDDTEPGFLVVFLPRVQSRGSTGTYTPATPGRRRPRGDRKHNAPTTGRATARAQRRHGRAGDGVRPAPPSRHGDRHSGVERVARTSRQQAARPSHPGYRRDPLPTACRFVARPTSGRGQNEILTSPNRNRVSAIAANATLMATSTPAGRAIAARPCPSRMTDRNPRITQ